jgi:hypothetical protein
LDGLPKGLAVANLPEAPQEFSLRVDKELKSNVKDLMK